MTTLETIFQNIASAIRYKNNSNSLYTPAQMINEIDNSFVTVVKYRKYFQDSTISSYVGNENYIENRAFAGCHSLTTVSFPECKYIGNDAFNACISLTNVSFPKCEYAGYDAFYKCYSLSSIYLPECINIQNYAFAGCTSLNRISFPKCEGIFTHSFESCISLSIASFPKCSQITTYVFSNCTNLISLYLTNSQVVSLKNSNSFDLSPLSAGGSGKIYVPSSLYSSYLIAPNWSDISARLVSI